jgi:hypothetical protein
MQVVQVVLCMDLLQRLLAHCCWPRQLCVTADDAPLLQAPYDLLKLAAVKGVQLFDAKQRDVVLGVVNNGQLLIACGPGSCRKCVGVHQQL